MELSVTNTAHMSSDTFSVELSYFAVLSKAPQFDKNWWSTVTNIPISIGVGYVNDGVEQAWAIFPTQLLAGAVDLVDFDWRKKTITITGRDGTSAFIDHKVEVDSGAFTNLTSSQIIAQLAVGRGFTVNQITSTSTLAGTYFGSSNAMMMQDRTEWDVMTFLAQQEGFIVAMIGNGIYFGPAASGAAWPVKFTDETATSISSANVVTLKTRHNLTLARGVEVTVQTFSQNDGVTHSSSATGTPKGMKISGNPAQFVLSVPNGTPAMVLSEVNKRLAQFVSHERPIEIECPGDETLTILQPIQLTGTGTAYDTSYPIDSITRTMNLEDGFRMNVCAKVGTPQTVTIS
jgi:hypothetical protein